MAAGRLCPNVVIVKAGPKKRDNVPIFRRLRSFFPG
jgi:hypothetical protein